MCLAMPAMFAHAYAHINAQPLVESRKNAEKKLPVRMFTSASMGRVATPRPKW